MFFCLFLYFVILNFEFENALLEEKGLKGR